MKYVESGFRPLYNNFCVFPLTAPMKELLKGQHGIDQADGVMTYGYVDHEAGNKLELVGLAKGINDEKYSFLKIVGEERYTVDIDSVKDEEYQFADYGNSELLLQFKERVDALVKYDEDESLVKFRKMSFLDEFRHNKNFDDVKLILYKEGMQMEGVWVRVEELGQGVILGTLMNKPTQDFGLDVGMPIAFVVHEDKDGKKTPIANLTPRKGYTPEELADGKILKNAILSFNEKKNQYRLYNVMEILVESKVIVPYKKNEVELLSNKNKPFFPVYSSSIETWMCEDGVKKTEMSFLEALKKAQKKNVAGIVVDAFSDTFVIPRAMFEFVEAISDKANKAE